LAYRYCLRASLSSKLGHHIRISAGEMFQRSAQNANWIQAIRKNPAITNNSRARSGHLIIRVGMSWRTSPAKVKLNPARRGAATVPADRTAIDTLRGPGGTFQGVPGSSRLSGPRGCGHEILPRHEARFRAQYLMNSQIGSLIRERRSDRACRIASGTSMAAAPAAPAADPAPRAGRRAHHRRSRHRQRAVGLGAVGQQTGSRQCR
jgi:hypothetical protein